MPTPTYILLNQITLAATSSSVTFSNIPQNYGDLILVIATSGAVQFRLNPNGDASNMSLVYMDGYGSSTGSGTDSKASLWYNASGSSVMSTTHLMDYSQIDKQKIFLTKAGAPGTAVSSYASRWASTSAITRLDIVNASTGTLAVGSTLYLYGVHA
jgi:hypothetical protein